MPSFRLRRVNSKSKLAGQEQQGTVTKKDVGDAATKTSISSENKKKNNVVQQQQMKQSTFVGGIVRRISKRRKSMNTNRGGKGGGISSSSNDDTISICGDPAEKSIHEVNINLKELMEQDHQDQQQHDQRLLQPQKNICIEIILLVFAPDTRQFELVLLEFFRNDFYISDILQRIPISVVQEELKHMKLDGICTLVQQQSENHQYQPTKLSNDTLLTSIIQSSASSASQQSKMMNQSTSTTSAVSPPRSIFVGIPQNVTVQECMKQARIILSDQEVIRLLKASGIDCTEWLATTTTTKAIVPPNPMSMSDVDDPVVDDPVISSSSSTSSSSTGIIQPISAVTMVIPLDDTEHDDEEESLEQHDGTAIANEVNTEPKNGTTTLKVVAPPPNVNEKKQTMKETILPPTLIFTNTGECEVTPTPTTMTSYETSSTTKNNNNNNDKATHQENEKQKTREVPNATTMGHSITSQTQRSPIIPPTPGITPPSTATATAGLNSPTKKQTNNQYDSKLPVLSSPIIHKPPPKKGTTIVDAEDATSCTDTVATSPMLSSSSSSSYHPTPENSKATTSPEWSSTKSTSSPSSPPLSPSSFYHPPPENWKQQPLKKQQRQQQVYYDGEQLTHAELVAKDDDINYVSIYLLVILPLLLLTLSPDLIKALIKAIM